MPSPNLVVSLPDAARPASSKASRGLLRENYPLDRSARLSFGDWRGFGGRSIRLGGSPQWTGPWKPPRRSVSMPIARTVAPLVRTDKTLRATSQAGIAHVLIHWGANRAIGQVHETYPTLHSVPSLAAEHPPCQVVRRIRGAQEPVDRDECLTHSPLPKNLRCSGPARTGAATPHRAGRRARSSRRAPRPPSA